jgi:hypothetical protein
MSASSQDTTDCFENIKKLLKEVVDAAAAGVESEEEWEMRARGRERESEEGLLTKLAVETEKNDMRMTIENDRMAHKAQKAEWEARMEIHQVCVCVHLVGKVKLCRDARDT